MTAGICIATLQKSSTLYFKSGSYFSRTQRSVLPSMMRTLVKSRFTFSHLVLQRSALSASSILTLSSVASWSPHDLLMHQAVSILSPVIIQILILALFSDQIVGLSLFCSLSSMPVMPRKSTPLSSYFIMDYIYFLSTSSLLLASWYFPDHFS